MSELPPYDGSFDLGGLPEGGPPVGGVGDDALFAAEGTFGAAPDAAPVRSDLRPPAPPPGPPAPAAPASPVTYQPPVGYRPPASVPGPAYPGRPPLPRRRPTGPGRLAVGLLAAVVAMGVGRGLSDGGSSSDPGADGATFPTWADPGSGSTDAPADDGVHAPMTILGTGLPNSADTVRIVVLGTGEEQVDYTLDTDGDVSQDSAAGDLTETLDFASTNRVVVTRDDGEDLSCVVYIDRTLVATTPDAGSPECVYDTDDIAAALPGE